MRARQNQSEAEAYVHTKKSGGKSITSETWKTRHDPAGVNASKMHAL